MQEHSENHREHVIIASVSGPSITHGPLIAFYTVWKVEGNNSYRAFLQGSLQEVFQTIESAHSAAIVEAKAKIDQVLGAE